MNTSTKKGSIGWLSAAHLVCDTYSGFMNPLMPFIAVNLGLSLGAASAVISISHLFSSMMQPVFGFFADNMLKRLFIFWGLVLGAIFIPLTTIAPNIYWLILFMVLGSIGNSFFHPQATGFVHKFADPKSNAMGLFMSFGSIGFSLGPILATFVVQYWGMAKLPITTIVGLITAGLMFNYVPQMSKSNENLIKKEFFSTFKDIFSSKNMRYLLIVSMMKTLVTNGACVLLPFLWKDMGYSPLFIGKALFGFIIAGGIGSFLSRKAENYFGTKNILYFSMCISFPLMIGFALTYKTHPTISTIIFFIMGFTTMLAQPLMVILGQKMFPQYKSIIAGLLVGFAWGIIALSLSVIGKFAEYFGIVNVLTVLFILPVLSSYFIKHLDCPD